jgi:5-methylcytosine-specific restriction endonuclease McrA
MAFSDDRLNRIFDRTSGYCHVCGKKLAFSNYGVAGARGAWEVEHSVPRCEGGTDHLNNLYAACIPCNRQKGRGCTRKARARHARTRAPLSAGRRERLRGENALAGGLLGATLGMVAGPLGVFAGALIGAKHGHDSDPDPN